MANQVAALLEADAARRLAGVLRHVHIPASVRTLLLTLIALLFGQESLRAEVQTPQGIPASNPWRIPRQDWHFSPEGGSIEDLAAFFDARAMRRIRRQRAFLGWVMRGTRHRGMRPSVQHTPGIPPSQTARAPPTADVSSLTPHPSFRPPPRAATTHARGPAIASPSR